MAVSLTIPRRGIRLPRDCYGIRGNETTLLFEFVLSMTSVRLMIYVGKLWENQGSKFVDAS